MGRPLEVYLELFKEFTKDSFNWCCVESEKATSRVSEILDFLVEDSDRISQMSEDTLGALDTMKEIIKSLSTDSRDIEKANDLSKALTALSTENTEVRQMLQPMLEALQFQDRITQNMDNIGKMIAVYLDTRRDLLAGNVSEFDEQAFGEKLVSQTTMVEEREAIRAHISGMEAEEKGGGDVLFF